jgi:tetratricopeptide (TPR) repeat protein
MMGASRGGPQPLPRASLAAALLMIAYWTATPLAHADAGDSYRRGVQAFRAGDYPGALRAFEAAEREGEGGAKLEFNLGSTYFKLGQLEQARYHFQRVADDPEWGSLAEFNLGLIAERERRDIDARKHFDSVAVNAPTERLRQLAVAKVTGAQAVPPKRSRGTGVVSFAAGYDDNVVLSEDPAVLDVSDEKDTFVDLFAAGSMYLTGTSAQGLRLDGDAYATKYADLGDFDIAGASAGFAWRELARDWTLEIGLEGQGDTVGGDYFTSTETVHARAFRPLGETTLLRVRAEGSAVQGASDFDYLTGWRARLGFEVVARYSTGRVRVGYLGELNDRDDLDDGPEFSSYSPTRHGFYAAAAQDLKHRVRMEARAEYRVSDYADQNRIIGNNGITTVEHRDEDRFSLSARAYLGITSKLSCFLDYAFVDNSSSIQLYEYTQNRVMLGIEAGF